jgi:hypothetical protein
VAQKHRQRYHCAPVLAHVGPTQHGAPPRCEIVARSPKQRNMCTIPIYEQKTEMPCQSAQQPRTHRRFSIPRPWHSFREPLSQRPAAAGCVRACHVTRCDALPLPLLHADLNISSCCGRSRHATFDCAVRHWAVFMSLLSILSSLSSSVSSGDVPRRCRRMNRPSYCSDCNRLARRAFKALWLSCRTPCLSHDSRVQCLAA